MVWALSVAGLVLLFIVLSLKYSPQTAIGWVVALSWLFPAWFIIPLFEGSPNSIVGTGVDVKMAAGTICLLLYCFMPGRTFPIRLVPCDYAMLALVITHLVSDISNDGFAWMILARMYVEWYLPYITGRIALQSWQDANRLWGLVATVGLLMAASAIPEALLNFNLFEFAFGERPFEGTSRDAMRWGIQRAYGQAMHPIYFGVMQLLLTGWTAYAMFRAMNRRGNALWVFALIPMFFGIIATGSRGPLLAVFVGLVGIMFGFLPRLRIPIGISVVAVMAAAVAFQEPLIRQMEKWSGEARNEVVIDGETHLQSSVRSRINVMKVNKIALKRSGLLGFGTRAVTGFPINVPLGPMEAEALKKIQFIDNTYILLTLRFGYAGAICFLAAALISLGQFYYIGTRYQGDSPQWFCHCVGAALFAALLALATVWMPYEIGFITIWTFGLSSGITWAHLKGKITTRQILKNQAPASERSERSGRSGRESRRR